MVEVPRCKTTIVAKGGGGGRRTVALAPGRRGAYTGILSSWCWRAAGQAPPLGTGRPGELGRSPGQSDANERKSPSPWETGNVAMPAEMGRRAWPCRGRAARAAGGGGGTAAGRHAFVRAVAGRLPAAADHAPGPAGGRRVPADSA